MATKKSLDLTDLFYKKSETRTRTEITNEIDTTIRTHEVIQGKVNKTDIKDNLTSTDTDKPLSANQGRVLKGLLDTKANTTTLNSVKAELEGRIGDVEDDVEDIEETLTTKVDKVAGKGLSTNDYTTAEKSKVATIDNKVDKVTGKGLSTNDYTTADKNKLAGIEAGANKTIVDNALNPNSTNPVQNAVICAEFYNKEDIIDLLNNIETGSGKLLTIYIDEETGDLVVDDDGFHYYTSDEVDEGFTIDVQKQSTPEQGYLTTYVISQGGLAKGAKINIPKDFLVKSASVETATADNVPIPGIHRGDKYIDFVLNVKEGTSAEEHLYLNLHDLTDVYTADETTLTVNNNQFSIKSVPVSLITGVLPANQVTHQDISGKVDKVTGKGLSTNDFNNSYKNALDNLSNNLNAKVDKVSGKGLSTNDYTTEDKNAVATISDKVDKVTGKGLSTNDYTTSEKNLVATIPNKVNTNDIKDNLTSTDTDKPLSANQGKVLKGLIDAKDLSVKVNVSDIKDNLTSSDTNKPLSANQGKVLKGLVDSKVNSNDLATVATSGSYDDLTDKPTSMPPTSHNHAISDVTNLQSSLNSKMDSNDYSTVNLSVVFEDDTTGSYDLVYHNSS